MTAEWVATDEFAGRREPDATVAPQGRIEPGVVLRELDRLEAWVYVEMPDGSRWWVDGRRLDRHGGSPQGAAVAA